MFKSEREYFRLGAESYSSLGRGGKKEVNSVVALPSLLNVFAWRQVSSARLYRLISLYVSCYDCSKDDGELCEWRLKCDIEDGNGFCYENQTLKLEFICEPIEEGSRRRRAAQECGEVADVPGETCTCGAGEVILDGECQDEC